MQNSEKLYEIWCQKATEDKDLVEELAAMKDNSSLIEDAFYRHLDFGTAGLRGVIGAGTNRMNIYTVRRATQGLANYIMKEFAGEEKSVAISFDSRIKSDYFAKVTAEVFAGNGIKVHIYRNLMPVPCLSFAVRTLQCKAGVMITASHNPAKYNGYKVYGMDGCQITTEAANKILREIEEIGLFDEVKSIGFDEGVESGIIQYIDSEIEDKYVQRVKQESKLPPDAKVAKDVNIVYSPLNGSGRVPVIRVLKESGYTNISVVKEQEYPDGNFPTCSYPNPEMREAMALGIEYAKNNDAELLLATDPDCDRIGIAVRNPEGEYVLPTGNQMGILLLDYVCAMAEKNNSMPEDPVLIKTIVSSDLADRVAEGYGVKTINVLTGFKYIGEQIALLEAKGRENSFVFGFEESCGYLSGTYVRDKDGVDAAFLICEMFAYYKSIGKTILGRLQEIYERFGHVINKVYSFSFEGAKGTQKMASIMSDFRSNGSIFGDVKVKEIIDYSAGIDGLPKADVIKFIFEGGHSAIVRPSGTEPKIKIYLSVTGNCEEEAKETEAMLAQNLSKIVG